MEELLAPTYRVGVYCRLSKEDDDIREGESQSISHQREIIEGFCKKKGWRVEDVYTDDGYSGTTSNMMVVPALHPPECHAHSAIDNLQIRKTRADFFNQRFLKWHAYRDIRIRPRQSRHQSHVRRIRFRTQSCRQHRMHIDGFAADSPYALQLRSNAHEHNRPSVLRRRRVRQQT